MGDGIMVLFGAPVAREDYSVRAYQATARVEQRVTLYADEVQRWGCMRLNSQEVGGAVRGLEGRRGSEGRS